VTRLLLDTHALVWWNEASPSLSARARSAIEDENAELHVSAASIYEIELKIARGRLAPWSAPTIELAQHEEFLELPILVAHAERAARLPFAHRDPWDRIIAAQAIHEGMTVLTRDPKIAALGAQTLW
jgi:PIN domain nuclease of toxin-antitoxin system